MELQFSEQFYKSIGIRAIYFQIQSIHICFRISICYVYRYGDDYYLNRLDDKLCLFA